MLGPIVGPGGAGVAAVSAAGVPVYGSGRPVPVLLEANPARVGELKSPRDESRNLKDYERMYSID